MRIPDDKFRIFVSHKHEDAAVARAAKQALQDLCGERIECFVSGENIIAGSDWNRRIRQELGRSHILLLLFTNPTRNWDWCLYEAGLFTRFGEEDVISVVCLYPAGGEAPSPLKNVQGVPAEPAKVGRFLSNLCKKTWAIADDWRRGALYPKVPARRLKQAAETICQAFPGEDETFYHPCHRVVLDMSHVSEVGDKIPEEAVVVQEDGATSSFTLSLFKAAEGPRVRAWGDLLDGVDGREALWREQLDDRFAKALHQDLFQPITATLHAWDPNGRHRRIYKPVLYRIHRKPTPAAQAEGRPDSVRPIGVTIIFDSQLAPDRVGGLELNLVRINARYNREVFERYTGAVRDKLQNDEKIFAEIREAIRWVQEEADEYGIFDPRSVHKVYGEDYEASGVKELSETWLATMPSLHDALEERDPDRVETLLREMGALNRTFSVRATKRYLKVLEASPSNVLPMRSDRLRRRGPGPSPGPA